MLCVPSIRDKLIGMRVEPHLVAWLKDNLTDRPRYVTLDCPMQHRSATRNCALSSTVHHVPPLCHMVNRTELQQPASHRHKTREIGVDFMRTIPQPKSVIIKGDHVEVGQGYQSVVALMYAVMCWALQILEKEHSTGEEGRLCRWHRAGQPDICGA